MSNIVLLPGGGGATLGTDLVGTVNYQIVKIGYSLTGIAPTQVSPASPLPVQLTDGTNAPAVKGANTAAQASDPAMVVAISPNQGAIPINVSSLPLPAGAATSAKQDTIIGVLGSPLQAGGTVEIANDVGNPIPVSGTVNTTPPANASTNIAQVGGVNVSTGTGVSGTGIPRVTVSNDSQVKLWDGASSTTVKPSGAPALPSDTAFVVALSPNSTPPADPGDRLARFLLSQLLAQYQAANANLGQGFIPQETPAFLGGF